MATPENRAFSNDTQLKNLKFPADCREPRLDFIDSQESGLRFRLSPSGKRTFVYRYFPIGQKSGKQVTLGNYPNFTLAEARDKVRELRKLRDAGKDPKSAMKKAKVAEAAQILSKAPEGRPAAYTVDKLSREWLDDVSTHRSNNTYKLYKNMTDKWILPRFGKLPVTDVDPDEIANLLSEVARRINPKTGKPTKVLANRLQSSISAMFSWCVDNRSTTSGLKVNPYYGRKKKGGRELPLIASLPPLSPEGVATRIKAILDSENDASIKVCLELIWRTGVRVNEALGSLRNEFDLENAIWAIPEARTKNSVPFSVMLPSQVVDSLEVYFDDIKPRQKAPIFPNDRRAGGIIGQELLNQAMRDIADSGRLHIARHAISSWAKRERYDADLRNRITNHVDRSIDATYSHADLDDPAREVWQRYNDELDKALKVLEKNLPDGK